MSRLAGTFVLICCLHAGFVYAGMECPFSNNNLIDKVTGNTCPRFYDSNDKAFCCYDDDYKLYCCDAEEFALKTGLGIIVPVIIAAAVIIGLVVCCISCLCCSCCPWYRRRHQGTVYGKVQTPVVQIIQPQANLPPSYPSQPAENYYVPYPTGSTGMPQPPPYTSEAYAKQAPYNPAYPPQ